MRKQTLRVLIADDQPSSIELVKRHLRELEQCSAWTFQIEETSSAVGAVKHIEKAPADLVFLDQEFIGGVSGDEIVDDLLDPFASRVVVLMSHLPLNLLQSVITRNIPRWGHRFQFMSKELTQAQVFDLVNRVTGLFAGHAYPAPLAHAHGAINGFTEAAKRFDAVIDLCECIVQYGIAILMAEMAKLGMASAVSIKVNWSSALTLGARLYWLKELLTLARPHQTNLVVPQLIGSFEEPYFGYESRRISAIELFYRLNEDRNLKRSHAAVRPDDWYQDLAEKYIAPMHVLYCGLRFLANFPLLHVEQIDLTPGSATPYRYQVRQLLGTDSIFPLETLTLSEPLPRYTTFVLRSEDRQVLPLDPLVICKTCKTCAVHHVYQLEGISQSTLIYKGRCNERIEERTYARDLHAIFPNLKLASPSSPSSAGLRV